MELTALQQKTVDDAKAWFKAGDNQCFVVHGYAGTGKSTIVKYIIEALKLEKHVAYVTFTGKASLVLNQKGCPAQTIHRLIYEVTTEIVKGVPRTKFVKVERLSSRIKLIILDEWSMPSEELIEDLLSYQVPILALGDPGQLPPIGKPNRFYGQCDAFLDEIHRQAEDNPIIKLSMMARKKIDIPVGIYSKDVCVIKPRDLRDISLKSANQVICGKNTTRQSLNEQMRYLFHGAHKEHPIVNDKLICLKNNWGIMLGDYPLINGMVGYAEKISRYNTSTDTCKLHFRPDFIDDKYYKGLKADMRATQGKPINFEFLEEDKSVFDYGYAITCHKSQGSSFYKLIVFEEILNHKEHHRWLYTAITRAEKQLILVKKQ